MCVYIPQYIPKLTFEDVARKLLVRFDEILLRNCREEPARRFERII